MVWTLQAQDMIVLARVHKLWNQHTQCVVNLKNYFPSIHNEFFFKFWVCCKSMSIQINQESHILATPMARYNFFLLAHKERCANYLLTKVKKRYPSSQSHQARWHHIHTPCQGGNAVTQRLLITKPQRWDAPRTCSLKIHQGWNTDNQSFFITRPQDKYFLGEVRKRLLLKSSQMKSNLSKPLSYRAVRRWYIKWFKANHVDLLGLTSVPLA